MQISGIQRAPAGLATTVVKAYYDPRDTNQDGIVSAAEELAYSLKHPELEPLSNAALASYTDRGAANVQAGSPGTLDLLA